MNAPPAGTSPPSRTGFLRNPWLWAFVIGVATITLLRPFLRHEPEPPPVLGRLPSFELIDQRGQRFGSAELAGDVYIANFIFTRCTSICPLLTRAMARLQDGYDERGIEDIKLVSFSVDPEYDTPSVLKEYSDKFGGGSDWQFLTGDAERITSVLRAFNALTGSKMNHRPFTLFKLPDQDEWVRIEGLTSATALAEEYRRLVTR